MGSWDLPRVVLTFEASPISYSQHSLLLVLVFVAKVKLMGLTRPCAVPFMLSCVRAPSNTLNPLYSNDVINFGVFY